MTARRTLLSLPPPRTMDQPIRPTLASSLPAALLLLSFAVCFRSPAEKLVGRRDEAAVPRGVAVGMWGGDDGWSIVAGGRLGVCESAPIGEDARFTEGDVSLARTRG